MSNDAASFVGSIPHYYDQGLGPIIFAEYAADLARRVAACQPARVLETAAGTGIVTRQLRDALPARTHLTATDLNPPMLDIARTKFRSREQVEFRMPRFSRARRSLVTPSSIRSGRAAASSRSKSSARWRRNFAVSSVPIPAACRFRRSCFQPRSDSCLTHLGSGRAARRRRPGSEAGTTASREVILLSVL
jgi:Methyltransferase domain